MIFFKNWISQWNILKNFQQRLEISNKITEYCMLYNISFLFYIIFFQFSYQKKNGEITMVIHVANFLHDIFLLYTNDILKYKLRT